MRILSFSYCFPNRRRPDWGVFVLQRLRAIARRPGTALEVVAPVPEFPLLKWKTSSSPPIDDCLHGLTVHYPRFQYVPGVFKSFDARLYARGLQRWLDQFVEAWQPDLLDAHFVWPDGVGVARLAARLQLPYTITLRGKIYPCLEIASQRRQCAEALQGAAAVISVDSRMARIACDLGAQPDRVSVIPNGVDRERFHPQDKQAARRRLGLPEQGRLLLTVGHLGVRKGHRETIQSLAQLPPDVQLVLVGAELASGRDALLLQKLAASLHVQDRVLLVGPQSYERIPDYFAAADASVLASYREGCPNVVLESLACGRPVVATDVGAVRDLITDGCNGRIVPVRDVPALTAALRTVLDQSWSADNMRHSPSVRSWDAVAQQVLDLFHSTHQSTRSDQCPPPLPLLPTLCKSDKV